MHAAARHMGRNAPGSRCHCQPLKELGGHGRSGTALLLARPRRLEMKRLNHSFRRLLTVVGAAAGTVAVPQTLLAGPSGDPFFGGLASSIEEAGKTWAPALLVLGALVVGGAIILGSHSSGEKVRNFLLGAVFLAAAAAGGAFILGKINGFGIN